jgi:uncharacterized protein (DUF302 family)
LTNILYWCRVYSALAILSRGKRPILGACNPPLAHQALTNEIEIGLLLPCNVIVYEADEGGSVVSAMNALAVMELAGNPALGPVAEQATEKLKRALARLPQA